MKIRAYQETDQDQVISLWKECKLIVPQNNPVRDIERKLEVDRELFLVGVSDGRVIASVMGGYDGHRGWINYLAVAVSERQQGYGTAMVEALERLLSNKGCAKINLQVRSANKAVIEFYSARGYRVDDVVGLGKRLEWD